MNRVDVMIEQRKHARLLGIADAQSFAVDECVMLDEIERLRAEVARVTCERDEAGANAERFRQAMYTVEERCAARTSERDEARGERDHADACNQMHADAYRAAMAVVEATRYALAKHDDTGSQEQGRRRRAEQAFEYALSGVRSALRALDGGA